MDDFSVNGFDSKVSRSSSSPNEAVLAVKLDFVKKTIPKYVLFCLIGFTDASLEDSRLMQLAVVVPHGPDGINVFYLPDAWKVSSAEPLRSLRNSQSIVGMALGQNQQLFSGCLSDVASGLSNRNR